jgi:hypothetical protein
MKAVLIVTALVVIASLGGLTGYVYVEQFGPAWGILPACIVSFLAGRGLADLTFRYLFSEEVN